VTTGLSVDAASNVGFDTRGSTHKRRLTLDRPDANGERVSVAVAVVEPREVEALPWLTPTDARRSR
jgi:hypothetical protein